MRIGDRVEIKKERRRGTVSHVWELPDGVMIRMEFDEALSYTAMGETFALTGTILNADYVSKLKKDRLTGEEWPVPDYRRRCLLC